MDWRLRFEPGGTSLVERLPLQCVGQSREPDQWIKEPREPWADAYMWPGMVPEEGKDSPPSRVLGLWEREGSLGRFIVSLL